MNFDDPSLRQFISPSRRGPLVGDDDQGKTLRMDYPGNQKGGGSAKCKYLS